MSNYLILYYIISYVFYYHINYTMFNHIWNIFLLFLYIYYVGASLLPLWAEDVPLRPQAQAPCLRRLRGRRGAVPARVEFGTLRHYHTILLKL